MQKIAYLDSENSSNLDYENGEGNREKAVLEHDKIEIYSLKDFVMAFNDEFISDQGLIAIIEEGNIESTCIKDSKIKFYFTVINIKSGEQEFDSLSLHKINTNKKSVDKYFKDYAKGFYLNPRDTKEDNGWYFWDCLAWVYTKRQEITEAEYYFLNKFI